MLNRTLAGIILGIVVKVHMFSKYLKEIFNDVIFYEDVI